MQFAVGDVAGTRCMANMLMDEIGILKVWLRLAEL